MAARFDAAWDLVRLYLTMRGDFSDLLQCLNSNQAEYLVTLLSPMLSPVSPKIWTCGFVQRPRTQSVFTVH